MDSFYCIYLINRNNLFDLFLFKTKIKCKFMNIQNTFISKSFSFFKLALIFFASNSLFSQSITAPVFTGGSSIFCAEPSSNTFNFEFTTQGYTLPNTFRLEMSDLSGSFASPTIQDSGVFSSSINILKLTVPPNFIGGDNYRFRIINTNSGLISAISLQTAIYYVKTISGTIQINNGGNFATICSSAGKLLSINDPEFPPSLLPSLKFKWFKDNVLISGQIGPSLLVTTTGVYYASLDYGACTGLNVAKTLNITVNFYTGGGTFLITSSNGNIVAPGVPTTLSTTNSSGVTYQWFIENGLISGETDFKYITDIPGTYYLEISDGTCPTKTNSLKLFSKDDKTGPNPFGLVIPNMVSPNNDGFNDLWNIPEELDKSNPAVLILDSKGKVAFETDNYLNNWPDSSIDFDTINPVYYYVITSKSGDVKKGSITIVK